MIYLLEYHKHTLRLIEGPCVMWSVQGRMSCNAEGNEWSAPLIHPKLWLLLLPPPFASIWAFWPPKKTDTRVKELHLSSSFSLTSSFPVLASFLSHFTLFRELGLVATVPLSPLFFCASYLTLHPSVSCSAIKLAKKSLTLMEAALMLKFKSVSFRTQPWNFTGLDFFDSSFTHFGFWIQTHSLSFNFGAVVRGVWASHHGFRRTRLQHTLVSSAGLAGGERELPSACQQCPSVDTRAGFPYWCPLQFIGLTLLHQARTHLGDHRPPWGPTLWHQRFHRPLLRTVYR